MVDLKALNSVTKYPSIPTYHCLGERGTLLEEHIDFGDNSLFASEKIDGTNSRVIVLPNQHYLIGSRQDLLTAQGDIVFNPAQGIVEAIRHLADQCKNPYEDSIRVYYFETFGGKTTKAAKEYTTDRTQTACRLFDVCDIPLETLEYPVEEIASWRESGGQQYLSVSQLLDQPFDLAPTVNITPIPESIEETLKWLNSHIPTSNCVLDPEATGHPEGLVVRSVDRSIIAKVRFEDYRRHLKKKSK